MLSNDVLASIPPGSSDITLQHLQMIFGADELVGWTPPPQAKKMDYSGALISVVELEWAPRAVQKPQRVVVKFVDPVEALAGVDQAKAERTIRSYANEAAFLARCCEDLPGCGCRVPRVYAVATDPQPAFRMLIVMECLTPEFTQLPLLPREASLLALQWLARFHAYGFGLRERDPSDHRGLW